MSFAPEDRLLLECARSRLTDANRAAAEALLERELDWEYVVEASVRHAVAPLLRNGLEQAAGAALPALVPEPALRELDTLLARSGTRNRRLYGVLGELLGAFGAAGVEVMALKDLQLAADVYPDVALRPIGDLDLLVHRSDYQRAAAVLAELHFEPGGPPEAPAVLRYGGGRHFRRAEDEVWIDLQWRILEREWDVYGDSPYSYDVGPLWERARKTSLAGRRALVPSPEDMLYHLCLHLEGHAYSELILFADLVELLECSEPAIDWDRFVEVVRAARGESGVWFALLLTERLLGAPVPPEAFERLEPLFFRGGLTAPLYGNLGSLHHSLDRIAAAAAPPERLQAKLELLARRQVARAIALERELDGIAASFREEGGTVLLLGGSPSPRLFPDPAVEPFGQVTALVPADELEPARRALERSGFLGPGDELEKDIPVSSSDPAVTGCEGRLRLVVTLGRDLPAAAATVSNRAAGARSLAEHLRAAGADDENVTARLAISALEVEELVVHVAAEAGRREDERLFAVTAALELFRRLPRDPDWGRVAEIAGSRSLERDVVIGLLLLEDVLGILPEPPLRRDGIPSPRALEWARYGPGATTRFPALRRAYYVALCLLLVGGGRARTRYLRRALLGGRGAPPILPRLLLELAVGGARALVRPAPSTRDLAYWAAPEPDEAPGPAASPARNR